MQLSFGIFSIMRLIPLLILLSTAEVAAAQISQGGSPFRWNEQLDQRSLPLVMLEPLQPLDTAMLHDGAAGIQYGVQRFVEVDVPLQGLWQDMSDGGRLCHVVIESEGALMMSLQFDRWELPAGAMVYVYDAARTRFIGGFDASNRGPEGDMATALIPGDRVVIEYRLPPGAPDGQLRVSSITHAYRDILGLSGDRDFDPGFQSAPCHINTACPEAAAWQDQKRAVAMFLRPTGGGCTGILLNNTAEPGKPYFHVAAHCYQPNESQWVVYFNYEAPLCVGDTGPTSQTVTGATLRASYYYDDFVLVELNTPPPASYNVYYAGWDRSGATPSTGTVIHHPLYDVKKITFNNGPVTSTQSDSWQLWRNYWDQGLVEAVSSGAPMFDQNKRMVGHMFDGAQDCNTMTTIPTDCAKFSASWDGSTATTRLRDWLDPANTTMALDGYDPNATDQVKVRVRAHLEGPFNSGTALMNGTLRANGLIPLAEPYTGLGYSHVNGGGGEATSAAVLAVSNGGNAIVDWVVIELRNKNNAQQVLATKCALIQRDGDIVATDGASDVSFNMPADQYHIAVRHRNHLGVMTATPVALSGNASLLDMGSAAVPLYGGSGSTKVLGSKRVLWAGDAGGNGTISYVGAQNDRDLILQKLGGSVPTSTLTGYHSEDLNMDGVVRYTGPNNDRDSILINIGGTVPTNVRTGTLP